MTSPARPDPDTMKLQPPTEQDTAQAEANLEAELLELLKDHPLRTDIMMASKEMAEYHMDSGQGARMVRMLTNVIDYTKLALRVYGR